MSNFLQTKRHVARKNHRCHECAVTIETGQAYVRLAGFCDGQAWHSVRCEACHALSGAVWDLIHRERLNEDDGPRIGGLIAWIADAGWDERLPAPQTAHFAAVHERLKS